MFIYHFNRLIRNKYIWGSFAFVVAIMFVCVGSCYSDPESAQTAGSLNGKKISLRSFNEIERSIRGFGRNRDNDSSVAEVDRKTWEQIAAAQLAKADGLGANDEEIRATLRDIPSFQGRSGFDLQLYTRALREQGLNPEGYERIVRHQLALMKISALVNTASWVPQMELDDELASLTDKFTVQIATVSNTFANADMKLGEADWKKYYEENTNSFALPDRVAVRYIDIPATNYLAVVTVSDDDARDFYDAHLDDYKRATTNKTSEIIPFDEVKDKIFAELRLVEAAECASTSATFRVYSSLSETNRDNLAEMAAELKLAVKESPLFGADDRVSFAEDGRAFAEAAFECDPERGDSRYGIAKSKNHVYVMEQLKTEKAHVQTYEEVLARIKPLAEERARGEAFDKAAKSIKGLLEKALSEGKSFAEAAQAENLSCSTQIVYSVNEIGKSNFPNNFSVAYGAMKTAKGKITDAISATPETALFVYVADRQPGDDLSGEMMRSQLRAGIARRRSASLFSDWLLWNLKRQKFEPAHPVNLDGNASEEEAAEEE